MADKKYTDEQEQIARFAKAMGHPARMAILQFLLRQETCFFGDIHEETAYSKSYSFTTSQGAERSRSDSRRNRGS